MLPDKPEIEGLLCLGEISLGPLNLCQVSDSKFKTNI